MPSWHPDDLDETDPFEPDSDVFHLFKHPGRSAEEIWDVWDSDPLFFEPAEGPADWLMVAEVPGGEVLVVPLVAGTSPRQARPIGVYVAGFSLRDRYRQGR